MLGNLHPKLRSTLRSIQMIAAVTSPNLQLYGYEKVLEPFIKDANKLTEVKGKYMFSNIYVDLCFKDVQYYLIY